MKGVPNQKIKCPFCGKKILIKNYTQHIKSIKCKFNKNKNEQNL